MRGLKLLASVIAGPATDISLWSWATVTDDSPLRVKLDGEDDALPVTPDSLVGGTLTVNDRVWVQLVTNDNPIRRYRRLVILGRAGGAAGYKVGDIYMSTSSTNPGTRFGGTWTRIQDRFLLAAGSTYTAGAMGGAATHTLTTNEIPGTIVFDGAAGGNLGAAGNYNRLSAAGLGGGAHNNMPPYLAVYVWERTA